MRRPRWVFFRITLLLLREEGFCTEEEHNTTTRKVRALIFGMTTMDLCILAVVLTACTVLLVTLFSKKGEQKPAPSRFTVRTNGDEEFYREGPAWQVFEETAINIPQDALCRATCWIYRIGGIDETRLITDFFGPFGAGTALHAKVKIGGEFREDLYVGTRPLKGSLQVCPVNWERMMLTEVSIDPERCRYDAVLEMSTHEAARHGNLSQKLM